MLDVSVQAFIAAMLKEIQKNVVSGWFSLRNDLESGEGCF
jgi:ABC-type oligopeptide transport system ATPase subunit